MSAVTEGDKLLSTRQLADELGLSMVCLQQWRHRGKGPKFLQFGPGSVKYRLSDVEAWLASCERQPGRGSDEE